MAALADKRNTPPPRGSRRPGAAGAQPQQQPSQPPRPQGGVPPLDAFDRLHRLPPPDLPLRGSVPPPVVQGENRGAGTQKTSSKARPAPPSKPKKPPKPKKPVNPARRRRRRRIAAVLALVVLVGLGAGLSIGLLFKIEKFELQGEVPYTLEQITEVFGYEPGEHMFSFSAGKARQRIETALPYIETVAVKRRLPSTVIFQAQVAQEAYCVPAGDEYAVTSAQLKVLRMAASPVEGLLRIQGLSYVDAQPGHPLALLPEAANIDPNSKASVAALPAGQQSLPESSPESLPGSLPDSSLPEGGEGGDEPAGAAEDGSETGETSSVPLPVSSAPPVSQPPALSQDPVASFDAMQQLLKELDAAGFTGVDEINVADPLELSFLWQGRVKVLLGARSGMQQKLAAALVLLTDEGQDLVKKNEKGTLDMRYTLSTGQTYFRPE